MLTECVTVPVTHSVKDGADAGEGQTESARMYFAIPSA